MNETGSSPLARGTRALQRPAIDPARIIPARAGNTYELRMGEVTGSDHPRSRGEHVNQKSMPSCLTGSSPLARGTQRYA